MLVNSSDGFEDCWVPFFTLLERYWKGLDAPILLNTENQSRTFDKLSVRCARAQSKYDRRLTWSECLAEALRQVETELVLYLQEDYFIEQPVDAELIQSLADLMRSRPDIKHIGLTHFGSHPPFEPFRHDSRLWTISPKARYRVSTQAGLWRKDALQSILLPWENGWMFEIFGSIRAARGADLYLTVRRDTARPPIYYQHTGIVKGRWSRFVEPLFEREGIEVDFSRRGFWMDSTPAIYRRAGLLAKIASHPLLALRSLLAK